ncbi:MULTISPECIES: response regulator [Nitrospirillum]|nr:MULTISPECIES: response regulator [Nitrospirillum]MEA1652524.1 response regulator [Nitrospirillum sp. BR 11164]
MDLKAAAVWGWQMGAISFNFRSSLVIEDQSFIRGVVVRILRQLDFGTVMEAEDGSSGLNVAMERRPDVIIADIDMAPVDGLTFLQHLRARETQGHHIPVVFLTNRADKVTVLKARDLGVDAFIAKPVTLVNLREKLQVVMAPRR